MDKATEAAFATFLSTTDVNSSIATVTTGNLASADVQSALVELQGDIDASAGGDMLQSVYDINANNIVDDAETVGGLTVQTAVPVGAVFTDAQNAAGGQAVK